MSFEADHQQKTKPVQPVVTRAPCKCGCSAFREASRITQPNGSVSVMYECTACGEYQL